jgi:hypothetical protein
MDFIESESEASGRRDQAMVVWQRVAHIDC